MTKEMIGMCVMLSDAISVVKHEEGNGRLGIIAKNLHYDAK